jgi:hypothetical protein
MHLLAVAAQQPRVTADLPPKINGFDPKAQRRKEKRKGYVKPGHPKDAPSRQDLLVFKGGALRLSPACRQTAAGVFVVY